MSATAATGQSWDRVSACRDVDPELFFPISKTGRAEAQIAEAKAVCAGCAVKTPCLELALRTGADAGIWGGLDEAQRQRMKRSLRSSVTPSDAEALRHRS